MTDKAKALVERVAMLPDGNAWPSTVELLCDLRDCIETQAREIERLRGVLKFYARENSWKSCGMYMCGHSNPSSAEIDRGNKARAALAGDSHDQ